MDQKAQLQSEKLDTTALRAVTQALLANSKDRFSLFQRDSALLC